MSAPCGKVMFVSAAWLHWHCIGLWHITEGIGMDSVEDGRQACPQALFISLPGTAGSLFLAVDLLLLRRTHFVEAFLVCSCKHIELNNAPSYSSRSEKAFSYVYQLMHHSRICLHHLQTNSYILIFFLMQW